MLNDWTFGGVRLQSIGAVTELDAYLDMPPKRGDNILIPLQPGKVWVAKYHDQRVVSFGIEISANDIPELEQKFDVLKALVGSRVQQALTHYYCDGPRSAMAEVLNILSPTRDPDPLVAKVVIDFVLADPYFRAPVVVSNTVDVASSPYTLNNPGTAEERKSIITLTGPLDNPILTNVSTGTVLQYLGVLANPGEWVRIDCGLYTAVDQSAVNVIGSIVHVGDTAFFTLQTGDNIITLADTGSSAGTAKIDFYPPYL